MCTVSTSYKANERCYSGNITYACLLNSMLNLVWTCTVAKVIKKIWQSHGSSGVFHDRWKIILVKTFALQEPKRAPGAAKHMLAFCTYISCHLDHSCSNKTGVADCWFPTDTTNCWTWHIPLNWHSEINLCFRFKYCVQAIFGYITDLIT